MNNSSVNTKRAKRNKKRKRLHKLLRYLRLTVFLCITAFIIIFIINMFVSRPSKQALARIVQKGTFSDGITINGVDVAGLTFDEAKIAILDAVEKSVQEVGISIVYDSNLWLLNASDIGVSANIDKTLTEAIIYGKSGNRSENAEANKLLKSEGVNFTVPLKLDEEAFSLALSQIAENFSSAPTEPYAKPDVWASSPSFDFVEGTPGYAFDASAIIEDVIARFEEGVHVQTITPELTLTYPTKTVEEVKAGIGLIAKFNTEYGSSSTLRETNRIANILKAANVLRGATIKPGETFSFNEFIGPRTEMGGWPPAPGIVNGNTYELQAGGGICQVSTTLYNALLRCGSEIEIVTRKHHSWPSSYVPYGLDATVSTDGPDLVFKNNMDAPIYIFAYANNRDYTMTVYIYGKPLEEGVSYKVYSEIIETIAKPTPIIEERSDWPTGYKEVDYKSREGYRVEAYRQKLVNGEKSGEPELLYTDKYRAVTGKTYVGTGDPSLPKP